LTTLMCSLSSAVLRRTVSSCSTHEALIRPIETGFDDVIDSVEESVAEQAAGLGDRGLHLAEHDCFDNLRAPSQ
jgi:hypothetical protein